MCFNDNDEHGLVQSRKPRPITNNVALSISSNSTSKSVTLYDAVTISVYWCELLHATLGNGPLEYPWGGKAPDLRSPLAVVG